MPKALSLYSFRELWRHYRNCRRNKRNTNNALAFEVDAEQNLLDLQARLRDHTYQPGRSICFVTEGAKPREVFAADFTDRVVHHLLIDHLQQVFEPRFIHDSYACRPGKGTLAATERLTEFSCRVTSNGRRPGWALKLDVASFFPSIQKKILYDIIARHGRHPELLWLTRVLLFHDPTVDYEFRSKRSNIGSPGSGKYPIPARKSLFGTGNEHGLPIGNLTSQFWANVYLNELDQFVKRDLRCQHYLRYVDDMILLSEDPQELLAWRDRIIEFLAVNLKLRLRDPAAAPANMRIGVEFIGWRVWWNKRLPRRQTVSNLRVRLDRFERRSIRPAWGGVARSLDIARPRCAAEVTLLRSVLGSYGGHLCHGNAWREWVAIWDQYPWLWRLFERDGWHAVERWPLLRYLQQRQFSAQYRQLLRHSGSDTLIFCQVGRFIEFYGPQRLAAVRAFRLIAAYRPRAGFGFTVGFPLERIAWYEQRALRHGLQVVQIREIDLQRGDAALSRRVVRIAFPHKAMLQRQSEAS